MKKLAPLLFLLVVGCSGNNDTNPPADSNGGIQDANSRAPVHMQPAEGNILVYIFRGNTQCNDDGLSNEDSVQALVEHGVDVIGTHCGKRTGLYSAAVCGGSTGDIIAHEIREENLVDANKLGYEAIQSLVDDEAGTDYQLIECPADKP